MDIQKQLEQLKSIIEREGECIPQGCSHPPCDDCVIRKGCILSGDITKTDKDKLAIKQYCEELLESWIIL